MMEKIAVRLCQAHPIQLAKLAITNVTMNAVLSVIKTPHRCPFTALGFLIDRDDRRCTRVINKCKTSTSWCIDDGKFPDHT